MKQQYKTSLLLGAGLVFVTGQIEAALITSDLETFSGGGNGSANTAIYTLTSVADSSFTLENSVTDGSFLDGADDGYARLHRTATTSKSNVINGAYGTIEAGDVGKVVTIDVAVRHEIGVEANWAIQLDGSNVGVQGDQSFFRLATFGSSDFAPDTNYQLSQLAAGGQNVGRTTGSLAYTIQAGDVGKALGLRLSAFDSTNSGGEGNRDIYIDSISYAVPEPGSIALLSLGGLLVARRQRK